MDTRDLEYLLAVERHGSIGKAADALGLSQPALTKAVQRLEAQVGVTLFERTANGMTPTPAAELCAQHVRQVPRRPSRMRRPRPCMPVVCIAS